MSGGCLGFLPSTASWESKGTPPHNATFPPKEIAGRPLFFGDSEANHLSFKKAG